MTTRRAIVTGMAALPGLAAADRGGAACAAPGPAASDAVPASAAPCNDWPDPQLCIQDTTGLVGALKDDFSGALAPITVTSYATGSRDVVCRTADTRGLLVGSLVQFSASADRALRANALRVTAVDPSASFTVTTEYAAGPATASTACLATIVCKGDTTGGAGGSITSQVNKEPSSTQVWISDRPAHTRLLKGCKRVLIVRKSTPRPEFIFGRSSTDRVGAVQGTTRSVGMGVSVIAGEGATAQCFVDDGADALGGTVATTASRTWVSMSHAISSAASLYYAGVMLTGPPGSMFVLGEFTETAGAGAALDGAFSTPRAQFIRFLASLSPWVGASLTTPKDEGFILDMQQTSNGAVNAGVSILTGLLEGQSQIDRSTLTSRTKIRAPTIFNPIIQQVGTGPGGDPHFYARAGGNFNLVSDAPQMFVYGDPSVEWKYLSFDFHGAILFAGP